HVAFELGDPAVGFGQGGIAGDLRLSVARANRAGLAADRLGRAGQLELVGGRRLGSLVLHLGRHRSARSGAGAAARDLGRRTGEALLVGPEVTGGHAQLAAGGGGVHRVDGGRLRNAERAPLADQVRVVVDERAAIRLVDGDNGLLERGGRRLVG